MEDFTINMTHSQQEEVHTLTFVLNGERAMEVKGEALSIMQLLRSGQKYLEGEDLPEPTKSTFPNIHLN